MRTAICLSGEMRNKNHCLELLKKQVIEPFAALGTVDLFIHTRKDPWWSPAALLPFRGLWIEENHRRDETQILSTANHADRGSNESLSGRRKYLYQSYLQQYESLSAVGDMMERAQRQDGQLYDWVVRARPDCHLKSSVPVNDLIPNVINFPWNDWWPYEHKGIKWDETLTDKFAIGNAHQMAVYLDKLYDLKRFCADHKLQGEAFTVWQLKDYAIPYVRHEGLYVVQADNPYAHSLRPDRNE